LKSLTVPGDIIASTSVPQITYYSEREVIWVGENEGEEQWHQRVLERKPKFMFISGYEPQEPWIQGYIQKHNMGLVTYLGDPQKPIAVILAFNQGEYQ
jgi:hypothetical protein